MIAKHFDVLHSVSKSSNLQKSYSSYWIAFIKCDLQQYLGQYEWKGPELRQKSAGEAGPSEETSLNDS